MKLVTLLFFGLLAMLSSCAGQQLPARPAPQAFGDTVSAIDKGALCIFQDRDDIYWFGSDGEGVYRYDGKTLLRFDTIHGLCNGRIRSIQQDSAGNMYFNTVHGISKFDGKKFVTLVSTKSSLPHGGWRPHPADLWFTGAQDSGVVYRYDGTTLHRLQFPETKAGKEFFVKFPRSQNPQMTFSPYDVYSIFKDSKGNYWFGTNIGLCRYTPALQPGQPGAFEWMSEEEIGIDAIAIHVRSTVEDKHGKFWFGNIMHRFDVYRKDIQQRGKAPLTYRKESGIVASKEHDAAYFMSATEDNEGNVWTVTYNKGAWRYDGTHLTQYKVQDGDKDVTLFSNYKDRHGNLWLGTHTAGVYKFNGKTFEKFVFYRN
ncbi:MAG: two-component regulator propeller domain-containing protein [Bacteroidota bacterium]